MYLIFDDLHTLARAPSWEATQERMGLTFGPELTGMFGPDNSTAIRMDADWNSDILDTFPDFPEHQGYISGAVNNSGQMVLLIDTYWTELEFSVFLDHPSFGPNGREFVAGYEDVEYFYPLENSPLVAVVMNAPQDFIPDFEAFLQAPADEVNSAGVFVSDVLYNDHAPQWSFIEEDFGISVPQEIKDIFVDGQLGVREQDGNFGEFIFKAHDTINDVEYYLHGGINTTGNAYLIMPSELADTNWAFDFTHPKFEGEFVKMYLQAGAMESVVVYESETVTQELFMFNIPESHLTLMNEWLMSGEDNDWDEVQPQPDMEFYHMRYIDHAPTWENMEADMGMEFPQEFKEIFIDGETGVRFDDGNFGLFEFEVSIPETDEIVYLIGGINTDGKIALVTPTTFLNANWRVDINHPRLDADVEITIAANNFESFELPNPTEDASMSVVFMQLDETQTLAMVDLLKDGEDYNWDEALPQPDAYFDHIRYIDDEPHWEWLEEDFGFTMPQEIKDLFPETEMGQIEFISDQGEDRFYLMGGVNHNGDIFVITHKAMMNGPWMFDVAHPKFAGETFQMEVPANSLDYFDVTTDEAEEESMVVALIHTDSIYHNMFSNFLNAGEDEDWDDVLPPDMDGDGEPDEDYQFAPEFIALTDYEVEPGPIDWMELREEAGIGFSPSFKENHADYLKIEFDGVVLDAAANFEEFDIVGIQNAEEMIIFAPEIAQQTTMKLLLPNFIIHEMYGGDLEYRLVNEESGMGFFRIPLDSIPFDYGPILEEMGAFVPEDEPEEEYDPYEGLEIGAADIHIDRYRVIDETMNFEEAAEKWDAEAPTDEVVALFADYAFVGFRSEDGPIFGMQSDTELWLAIPTESALSNIKITLPGENIEDGPQHFNYNAADYEFMPLSEEFGFIVIDTTEITYDFTPHLDGTFDDLFEDNTRDKGDDYDFEGDDQIKGDDDADEIMAGDGDNIVKAGGGNDFVRAGKGEDEVEAGDGDDFVNTGMGNDTVSGGAGNDKVKGRYGDDFLTGDEGDDEIFGGHGSDKIWGGADNDRVNGGDGDDELLGDEGDDRLWGGEGSDIVKGGVGADRAKGGVGDDIIEGGAGEDRLDGEEGNDEIDGGDDDDRIRDLSGNNNLKGGNGNDKVKAGDGDDIIYGDAGDNGLNGGDDRIDGGGGADRIFGEAGNDRVKGGDGDDIVVLGDGNDMANGGSGNDVITGGNGEDAIKGGNGADVIDGGADHDIAWGGNGNDMIQNVEVAFGGSGNDTIIMGDDGGKAKGGDGVDVLMGGNGNDIIYGGNDNDTIRDGLGQDILVGGADADTYILSDDDERDFIKFIKGEDQIDISAILSANSVDTLDPVGDGWLVFEKTDWTAEKLGMIDIYLGDGAGQRADGVGPIATVLLTEDQADVNLDITDFGFELAGPI